MNNETEIQVHFPTEFDAILNRIETLNPIDYGASRNYLDGAVSYLSPYISRGVISTKFVYQALLKRGFHPSSILKFIQELANVPEAYIHEPWKMSVMEQTFCGRTIGVDYPKPIVDLKTSAKMTRDKIWGHKKHAAVKAEKKNINHTSK